jgi:hypothetical protein
MKTFTIINLIAQPLLVLMMIVWGSINFNVLATAAFVLFCALQIFHFIIRILPQHRRHTCVSNGEYLMGLYLVVIVVLSLLSILISFFLAMLTFLLLLTCLFSAIGNYVASVGYYHFLTNNTDENF